MKLRTRDTVIFVIIRQFVACSLPQARGTQIFNNVHGTVMCKSRGLFAEQTRESILNAGWTPSRVQCHSFGWGRGGEGRGNGGARIIRCDSRECLRVQLFHGGDFFNVMHLSRH